jgi:general stress protein 26
MLATAEGGHPRVRPVTLINYDHKFWVATGTNSAKVREIKGNPNIEFCLQFQGEAGGGYVRIAGLGDVVTDHETKKKLAEHIDYFDKHWTGADDPSYALIQIIPVEVEYMRPGDMDAQRFGV